MGGRSTCAPALEWNAVSRLTPGTSRAHFHDPALCLNVPNDLLLRELNSSRLSRTMFSSCGLKIFGPFDKGGIGGLKQIAQRACAHILGKFRE
jgi:hypothetical protein